MESEKNSPQARHRGQARVRLAKGEKDFEEIFKLCALAHREGQYGHLPLDEAGLRRQIDHDINAEKTNGIILAEQENGVGETEVLGLLSAVAGKLAFVNVISASALIFYIKPEARDIRTASLLLKAFEKWAQNRKAYDLAIHVTMGREDDVRVSRLLNRFGFKSTGGGSHFRVLC
ncbi:hypothetical protein QMT40_000136 [Parvibaculaceae bacterium PLY_AMNH_Bact1]|nr:hypothetical protein QMT40_000136 [Parvibaculaceae bacterium PLY_AMNH_Bact1]